MSLFVLFSLNALDPKLVWHIEKETKGGRERGGVGEARMDKNWNERHWERGGDVRRRRQGGTNRRRKPREKELRFRSK